MKTHTRVCVCVYMPAKFEIHKKINLKLNFHHFVVCVFFTTIHRIVVHFKRKKNLWRFIAYVKHWHNWHGTDCIYYWWRFIKRYGRKSAWENCQLQQGTWITFNYVLMQAKDTLWALELLKEEWQNWRKIEKEIT